MATTSVVCHHEDWGPDGMMSVSFYGANVSTEKRWVACISGGGCVSWGGRVRVCCGRLRFRRRNVLSGRMMVRVDIGRIGGCRGLRMARRVVVLGLSGLERLVCRVRRFGVLFRVLCVMVICVGFGWISGRGRVTVRLVLRLRLRWMFVVRGRFVR